MTQDKQRHYDKVYALVRRAGMAGRSRSLGENLARIAEALGCEPDSDSIVKAVARIRKANSAAREKARRQAIKDYPYTTQSIIRKALSELDKKNEK